MFNREYRYTGGPREPLYRRVTLFLNACELGDVDINDSQVMLRILPNSFLAGQALVYYSDKIKPKSKTVGAAVKFLSDQAKRVNDQVWDELTFQFME